MNEKINASIIIPKAPIQPVENIDL